MLQMDTVYKIDSNHILRLMNLAKNSVLEQKHSAIIIATKGPKRGEIIAAGYNKRFSFKPSFEERQCLLQKSKLQRWER